MHDGQARLDLQRGGGSPPVASVPVAHCRFAPNSCARAQVVTQRLAQQPKLAAKAADHSSAAPPARLGLSYCDAPTNSTCSPAGAAADDASSRSSPRQSSPEKLSAFPPAAIDSRPCVGAAKRCSQSRAVPPLGPIQETVVNRLPRTESLGQVTPGHACLRASLSFSFSSALAQLLSITGSGWYAAPVGRLWRRASSTLAKVERHLR